MVRRESKATGARETALQILHEIDQGEAYANIALKRLLDAREWTKLDRAFITELIYGVVRNQKTLDWVLEQQTRRPLAKTTAWVRNILRMAAYQILFMDKVPPPAATHQAVELAKKYGHAGIAGFVNGVLRQLIREREKLEYPDLVREPVRHISIKYSHPDWLVERWLKRYGTEGTIALCQVDNQPAPVTIRTNTLKTSRDGLIEVLAGEGVKAEPGCLTTESIRINGLDHIDGLPSFAAGLFLVQDEAAQLVSHVLNPKPEQFVLDACAAPGTKTTHLAQLMQNKGQILAWDIHPHKIALIEENCRRLGISIVTAKEGDARRLPHDLLGKVDAMLLDAPCSGTGVLRRRPDSRWRKTPETIFSLQKLQREIMSGALPLLKPGGVLVYSTCSIEAEENLENIRWALQHFPGLELDPLPPFLPETIFRQEDLDTAAKGYLQLLPHIHGTDGFFIARMQKSLTS
ncbi:MAG: 16S rRNA (cytosine(967)-C(5))-methyltransferase RsmB [Syntrophomonadaceae bacterium]|nr:16S rRNA (cytosine(967)-C(5))-methyltransferase RsmB [Syntrophomonadaceae bacterium]